MREGCHRFQIDNRKQRRHVLAFDCEIALQNLTGDQLLPQIQE